MIYSTKYIVEMIKKDGILVSKQSKPFRKIMTELEKNRRIYESRMKLYDSSYLEFRSKLEETNKNIKNLFEAMKEADMLSDRELSTGRLSDLF